MFEMYYALYKINDPIFLIYAIMATLVVHKKGQISDHDFTIDSSYPKKIRKVMNNLKAKRKNTITYEDFQTVSRFLKKSKDRKKYYIRIPLIGFVNKPLKSKNCNNEIKNANSSIISFIETGDVSFLDEVNVNISKFHFRLSDPEQFGSFYRNNADAGNNAVNARYGIINTDRYEYYYTNKGNKKNLK